MSKTKKTRINELARELEVKAQAILDVLPKVGVVEKKTHSSSIEEDAAKKIREHFRQQDQAPQQAPKTTDELPPAKQAPSRPVTSALPTVNRFASRPAVSQPVKPSIPIGPRVTPLRPPVQALRPPLKPVRPVIPPVPPKAAPIKPVSPTLPGARQNRPVSAPRHPVKPIPRQVPGVAATHGPRTPLKPGTRVTALPGAPLRPPVAGVAPAPGTTPSTAPVQASGAAAPSPSATADASAPAEASTRQADLCASPPTRGSRCTRTNAGSAFSRLPRTSSGNPPPARPTRTPRRTQTTSARSAEGRPGSRSGTRS